MTEKHYIQSYDCDKVIGQHYNCIYIYINKVNKKKYVGQAKDLIRRHKGHLRKNSETIIDRAIRKYGLENFRIVVLKDNLKTQCLLNFYETYYIKKFDTLFKDKCGYNISDGGHNGNCWAGKSEVEIGQMKDKISKANKGKRVGVNSPHYGKKWSEERRLTKSIQEKERYKNGYVNPNKGKVMTEEQKEKLSESKKLSKKNKGANCSTAKIVLQYDLDGNFIKEWSYIKEATCSLGITDGEISRSCTSQRTTAGGYQWRYKDNDNFPRKIKSSNNQTNKPKLVGQFTKEGDLIKLWDSARKATQETKINNIHKCCQGRCKTAGGYIWKYVDES